MGPTPKLQVDEPSNNSTLVEGVLRDYLSSRSAVRMNVHIIKQLLKNGLE